MRHRSLPSHRRRAAAHIFAPAELDPDARARALAYRHVAVRRQPTQVKFGSGRAPSRGDGRISINGAVPDPTPRTDSTGSRGEPLQQPPGDDEERQHAAPSPSGEAIAVVPPNSSSKAIQ